MAERSKATDSSSVLFGGVSSNLTGCIFYSIFVHVYTVYIQYIYSICKLVDTMAEWLRREIRNLVGSARVGSNPTGVVAQKVINIFVHCTNLSMFSAPTRARTGDPSVNSRMLCRLSHGSIYSI